MSNCIFAFDLDGTVTTQEILPAIASLNGCGDEMRRLTAEALNGGVSFEASFRQRFAMLRDIPLHKVQALTASVPLDPAIETFIMRNQEHCALVTGNVERWIRPITQHLRCRCYCSRTRVEKGRLKLVSVLDKGQAIRELARQGKTILAIGESANDIPMFREADIRIAYAGVHPPAPALLPFADHVVENGPSLCSLLEELRLRMHDS